MAYNETPMKGHVMKKLNLKLIVDKSIEAQRVKHEPDSNPQEYNTEIKRYSKRLALGAGLFVGAIAAAAIVMKTKNDSSDEIENAENITPED